MKITNDAGPSIDSRPSLRLGHAIALWLVACAVVVAVRFRSKWTFYVDLHERLAEMGLHPEIRRLDSTLLMICAAFLLAAIGTRLASVTPTASVRGLLLIRPPSLGWMRVSLLGSLPMVAGGALLMISGENVAIDAEFWSSFASGVIRAPINEEVFFRGAMVALPAAMVAGGDLNRLRGRVFWIIAGASALAFGAVHITWSLDGLADGWTNLLVTAIGGLWFSWLMVSLRSIAVPVMLHASMNLGWLLAGASGAGGGGLLINLCRAGTIALTTWLTIRAVRRAR